MQVTQPVSIWDIQMVQSMYVTQNKHNNEDMLHTSNTTICYTQMIVSFLKAQIVLLSYH
jgi:hypothetical protein